MTAEDEYPAIIQKVDGALELALGPGYHHITVVYHCDRVGSSPMVVANCSKDQAIYVLAGLLKKLKQQKQK